MDFSQFTATFCDLSMAHIRPSDDAILHDPPPNAYIAFSYCPYSIRFSDGSEEQVGWFIVVEDFLQYSVHHIAKMGFSLEFINLLTLVAEAGFSYLRLDRDAEKHPDFPVFEW